MKLNLRKMPTGWEKIFDEKVTMRGVKSDLCNLDADVKISGSLKLGSFEDHFNKKSPSDVNSCIADKFKEYGIYCNFAHEKIYANERKGEERHEVRIEQKAEEYRMGNDVIYGSAFQTIDFEYRVKK